ncbi:MAG: GHKL domain-containing protein [Roseivirga sp.]|nr:GHKL domain-containing protein [Roseivirga sp.]
MSYWPLPSRNAILWIVVMLTVHAIATKAQYPLVNKYRFEKDHRLDRLVKNKEVKEILQDDEGLLWIATTHGLIKYDGLDAKLYEKELIDSAGVPRDYLLCMAKAENGILWLGTYGQGLIKFDTWKNTFTFYEFDANQPGTLSDNGVFDLHIDKKGVLWVATYGGLNVYQPDTDSFIQYVHNPGDPKSLSNNDVYRIDEDQNGNIWLATYGGINKLDVSKNEFTRYVHDANEENSIYGDNITSIYIDDQGMVWSCSYQKGLNKLDPKTGKIDRFLPGHSIFKIYKTTENELWLATSSGLLRFDVESGKVLNMLLPDSNDPLSISSKLVRDLYQDNSGNLWIAFWGQGINKLNLNNNSSINYYPIKEAASNTINAFYNDESTIWLGSGSGLVKVNKQNMAYDVLDIGINVNDMQQDNQGNLWLSNYNGLYSYNPQTGTVSEYTDLKQAEGSNLLIRDLYLHQSNELYIGSWDGGLRRFNIHDKSTELISHPTLSSEELDINILYADSQGILWIGTHSNGLIAYDLNEKEYKPQLSTLLKETNSSGVVDFIYEDKRGIIWVATRDGLVNFHIEHGIGQTYTSQQGFPSLTIFNIMEDDDGNIWFTSKDGVVKFDLEEGGFQNFPSYDFQAYNPSISSTKDENGNFYFGGQAGLNVVHPDGLFSNEHDPDVVITKLFVAHNPVNLRDHLETSTEYEHKIRLPYRQNAVSFEFAAIDFSDPEEIVYNYRLNNFKDDWITADASHRTATYTNLEPGHYIFEVKSTNSHGYWNDKLKQIELIITPPFWMTWWFRGLLGITVALSIIGLYRWRTNAIRKQNKQLEKLVAVRTHELDEVNKERIEFLNIFTHDIVDPLTSIELLANRLQSNVYTFSGEEIEKACRRIEFNTSRISSLTNNILKAGLLDSNRLKLTAREFDVVKVTQHVIQEYQTKGLEKNISIELESDSNATSMFADRSAFVQVIGNLLSNAIKYSEQETKIEVSLNILKDMCVIKIKDHGLGFTAEDQKEIFQKFKTLSARPTADEPSSGLGLFIVKMLVDKMEGTISFKSTYGKGTEFTISLGLGKVIASADADHITEDRVLN